METDPEVFEHALDVKTAVGGVPVAVLADVGVEQRLRDGLLVSCKEGRVALANFSIVV